MNNQTNNLFEHKIEKLFESAINVEPKSTLLDAIMLKIYRKQRLYFQLKLAASAAMLSTFSISALFWGKAAFIEFSGSEAWALIKVLFSDFGSVVSNWQVYSTYFLESLPVASTIWLMLGLFVILLSFKILIQGFAHRPRRLGH